MAAKKIDIIPLNYRLCDRDHFQIVKGISIFIVVMAYFCATYLGFDALNPLMGVSGAICMFCSGYGLSESFIKKSGLSHYWENKMMKVWIPSVLSVIALSLASGGDGISWIEHNFLGMADWFLYMVFGAYLAFWVLFQFTDSKNVRIIGLFVCAAAAMVFVDNQSICRLMPAFPVGVLFSQQGWRRIIRNYTWKGKTLLTAISLALAAGLYFLSDLVSIPFLKTLVLSVAYGSGAAFVIFGVYFARKILVFNVFFLVGAIAYAAHLLYKDLFYLLYPRLQGGTVAIMLVVLIVIAAAYSWLCDLMVVSHKKLRRQKGAKLKGSM